MKKIIIISIFSLFMVSFLISENLLDYIIKSTYEYSMKFGKIVENDKIVKEYSYFNNGNLVRTERGHIIEEFSYDSMNNLVEVKIFFRFENEPDDLRSLTVYKYNSENKIINKTSYDKDGLVSRLHKYEYTDGQYIEYIFDYYRGSSEQIQDVTIKEYNEDNDIILEYEFNDRYYRYSKEFHQFFEDKYSERDISEFSIRVVDIMSFINNNYREKIEDFKNEINKYKNKKKYKNTKKFNKNIGKKFDDIGIEYIKKYHKSNIDCEFGSCSKKEELKLIYKYDSNGNKTSNKEVQVDYIVEIYDNNENKILFNEYQIINEFNFSDFFNYDFKDKLEYKYETYPKDYSFWIPSKMIYKYDSNNNITEIQEFQYRYNEYDEELFLYSKEIYENFYK